MNKTCPLCKKYLLEIGNDEPDYICPTRVKLKEGDIRTFPHYEDRYDNKFVVWVVPPFKVESTPEDKKSRIFKLSTKPDSTDTWQEILVTAEIHADSPEKLIKRVKILIPFI